MNATSQKNCWFSLLERFFGRDCEQVEGPALNAVCKDGLAEVDVSEGPTPLLEPINEQTDVEVGVRISVREYHMVRRFDF